MTWEPIETAPKDGTLILVCRMTPGYPDYDLGPTIGWWEGPRVARGRGRRPGWFSESDEFEPPLIGQERWLLTFDPTHWQPLPAPPVEPEDGR
jgi:hypothetical protein